MNSLGACGANCQEHFSLADAQTMAGHAEEGLTALSEALARVEETDERHWEAKSNRLRSKLLLM